MGARVGMQAAVRGDGGGRTGGGERGGADRGCVGFDFDWSASAEVLLLLF